MGYRNKHIHFHSALFKKKLMVWRRGKEIKADTQSYYVILDIVHSVEKISFLRNANGTALESFMGLLQLRFRHGTIL